LQFYAVFHSPGTPPSTVTNRGQAGKSGAAARPVRIALWGNFGTLNLGNECTLAAAINNLRRRVPDAELISVCSEPDDVASRHGIVAVAMGATEPCAAGSRSPKPLRAWRRLRLEVADWLRALRVTRQIRALLITGTGILTDHGEGTLGLPYHLFKWSLAAKLHGCKLLFVSVGVESITRPLARFFLKSALRIADYRCYRDEHSAALLRRAGFDTSRDPIFPDLAFSLPAPPPSAAGGAQRRVAVGIFNYRECGRGSAAAAAQYAAYLDRLCSFILWLLEHHYTVRVVIGDFAYDEEVRADLRARLQARGLDTEGASFADEPATSFEQLLAQLATVDLVIASRFHNVLLALLLGKPVVSVSYEAKNEALMRQMGLGHYCQTLDGLDLQRLIEQFLDLEKNAAALREIVAEQTAANRSRLELQYDSIVASVSGT